MEEEPKQLISIEINGGFVRETTQVSDNDDETMIAIGKEYNEKMKDLYAKNPNKKYKLLIDTRKTEVSDKPIPQKTQDYFDEITNMDQTTKAAVLGRVEYEDEIIEIMFKQVERKKASYFIDEDRALRWLGVSE